MLSLTRRRFVRINFLRSSGEMIKSVDVNVGASLLDAAITNDIDVEGACGGQCACATCHMILPKTLFNLLPPPKDDEADMLDLAADVTSYSRLGCQVKVSEALEGMDVRLPALVINQLD